MTTRTRIQPLDRSFALALDEMLDPGSRSKQFAAFASEEIERAAHENRKVFGRDVDRTIFVDGKEGAPLDSVSPTGAIVARFEIGMEVLDYIRDHLIKGSPVLSGDYSRSHIMLADGVEVAPEEEVPAADAYTFVNTQPYARKIEGAGGRGPQSPQAALGVYQVVAAMAARRFGNIARITFGWGSFAALGVSALESWASETSARRVDRDMSEAKRAEWLRRQPAIYVRLG